MSKGQQSAWEDFCHITFIYKNFVYISQVWVINEINEALPLEEKSVLQVTCTIMYVQVHCSCILQYTARVILGSAKFNSSVMLNSPLVCLLPVAILSHSMFI